MITVRKQTVLLYHSVPKYNDMLDYILMTKSLPYLGTYQVVVGNFSQPAHSSHNYHFVPKYKERED